MNDLESAVLREVIDGPGWMPHRPGRCWSERRRLELIGGADVVDGLVADGWLCTWAELGSLTLTPWAAERLGVRLECGEEESEPTWVPVTDPEPVRRLPRWQRSLPSLDHLPQPKRHQEPEQGPKVPKLAGGLGGLLRGAANRRAGRKLSA